MIAPIDIACPACEAKPGDSCQGLVGSSGTPVSLRFHHAERVDAAARWRPATDHVRAVYDAVIAWRRRVDLRAGDPMTQHMLAVVDAAIAAQEAS